MTLLSDLRVAVVHDWLTGMRGGEKVLEAILDLFPSADIYTLFHFHGSVSEEIESRPIFVSPLQGFAERVGNYRNLLPLFPAAIATWSFDQYDLVISSSHCVAKNVAAKSPHVSYCHTPMRYIWDRFDDYFPPSRPLTRFAGSIAASVLRRWDVRTVPRVTQFVANSNFVKQRIERFYHRDAAVVHPFVDDMFLNAPMNAPKEPYHLVVSALVPYKKIELAIEAAVLGKKKLRIIGSGPLHDRLKNLGGDFVELAGWAGTAELLRSLQEAQSLLYPGVEDFGITALEAMASGTPVVAYSEGGALDSVVEGESGMFFREQTPAALLDAMNRAEAGSWDRQAIRAQAAKFSKAHFQQKFRDVVADVIR